MAETRSIEQLLADIDKEVAALPPGSDLAGFISKRHREIGELLARRVVDQRLAASPEAASPPSGVSEMQPSGDAPSGEATPKKGRPSRG